MIAVTFAARRNPMRRRPVHPAIPKTADPPSIGGRLEEVEPGFQPLRVWVRNKRTSCFSFVRFGCLPVAFSSTGTIPRVRRWMELEPGHGPRTGVISDNDFLPNRRLAVIWTNDPRQTAPVSVRFRFDEMPQVLWPRYREDGQSALQAGGGSRRDA